MASTDLVFRFLGIDSGAGLQFDRMAKKATGAELAVKRLAKGAAIAGAVIGVASVKAAANYQTEMVKLQTQAGKTTGEVQRMSKAMLSLAGPTATAPTELAKGLFHLESAGVHGARAVEAMRVAAEGAKLGGANLEDVTNALNAAIASGIPGVQNLSQAMGYLNATVGEGDMRMQDLADALGTGVLAIVKSFGVTMRDASAALAVFGDNNIRGAQAGTDLRVAIQSLAHPAATGAKVLQDMGIGASDLAVAMQQGGLNQALHLLKSRMDSAGVSGKEVGQVITDAFGRKSSASLALLIGQMSRFDQKFNDSEQASKHFGASWQGYTKTFQYRFDRMRESVQVLAIKLGTELLPAATALADFITHNVVPALSAFGSIVRKNKSWLEPLTKSLLLSVAAWKSYVWWTKAAAGANALFGRAKVTSTAASALTTGASMTRPVPVFVTNPGFGGGKGVPPVIAGGEKAAQESRAARILNSGLSKALIAPAVGYAVFKQMSANLARGGIGIPGLFHIGGQKKVDPLGNLTPQFRKQVEELGGLDKALAYYRKLNVAASHDEQQLGAATVQTTASVHQQTQALADMQSKSIALSGSQDELRQAVHNMAVVVGSNSSKALKGNSDAALANRDALRAAVQQALDYLGVLKQGGATRREVMKQEVAIAKAIRQSATDTYGDKAAVDHLLRSLGFMPGQIQAVIDKYRELRAVVFNPQQGTGKNSPFLDPGHPGYVEPAKKSAKKTGKDLADSLVGGYSPVVDAGVAAATQAAQDAADRMLQKHTQKFKSDLAQAKQLISSTRDTLAGFADLANNADKTDVYGRSMGPTPVNAYLKEKARSLEKFAHLFKRLDKMGLDNHLLAQFAQIGPDAIPAMQQLLHGGHKAIRRADRLERRILAAGSEVGQRLTRDEMGKQLHTDLEKLPKRIAHELKGELKGLNIDVNLKHVARHRGRRIRNKS